MMKRQINSIAILVLLGGLLTVQACVPIGAAGGVIIPANRSTVLQGEIQSVDLRRNRIRVRADNGRNHTVRYDSRTSVVYRFRQYPAAALERGDYVRVVAVVDRQGRLLADRVDVRENVRDRRHVGRMERLDGYVGVVDVRGGYFSLERSRMPTLMVRMPQRLPAADARRFERLRRGDRIRAEVLLLGARDAELVRFR
jgi:hypothetical protein